MMSRGQCPRGCVLVNVFTPPPPPPSGNPVSAPGLGGGMSCAAPRPALALDATEYMWIHVDTCEYMGIHVDIWGYMGIYIYI